MAMRGNDVEAEPYLRGNDNAPFVMPVKTGIQNDKVSK